MVVNGLQNHVIRHGRAIFLGYVKSQAYKNNPRLILELKDGIIRVIVEIEPQLCQNVFENFNG